MPEKNIKEDNVLNSDKEYSFSDKEIQLLEKILTHIKQRKETKKDSIPISVFNNKALAPLETIVKYLKEELDYTYKEIATLLNRNPSPIGITYRKANKKFSKKLDTSSEDHSIPISIFKNSKLTIFETIVLYLKDSINLKFNNISTLLNRNYRTIWTVYKRAKKK
ncbi:MAG: hypothetical protein U9O94_00380 [Nanoarchaeota archaeon]|nr:hypothetical protein [Nanoarchaeota archaeon]